MQNESSDSLLTCDSLFLLNCLQLLCIFLIKKHCFLQGQKKSSTVGLGALFHDHLFSILFIFTGIFMVNYVLMNSAAAESTNTLLITFQDVVELMNQVST